MSDDASVTPVYYERGDAKVVFGENGTHSLWDASIKLGVGLDSLLALNGGSDVVQAKQEMRVPRELILRGAKGMGSISKGGGKGGGDGGGGSVGGGVGAEKTKRGGHANGETNEVGPVWRDQKKVVTSGHRWNLLNHNEADDTYLLPFPLVGAAAAAREDWGSNHQGSSLIAGPPDRPDLFPLEPELDILPDAKPHFRDFLAALRWVETGNQMPAPDGDDGASIGPYQISREYHEDAWNPSGCPVTARRLEHEYWRCDEIEYSERTVVRFMKRWAPWALRHGDFETLARVHNAGPGYRNAMNDTGRYWWKVRCRAPHLMFGVARSRSASVGPSASRAVDAARARWPR